MLPFDPTFIPDSLGDMSPVSPETRMVWESVRTDHMKAMRYYSGEVFTEKVETESGEEGPELFPLGINLVKMLTLAMADSMFGEFDEFPVLFEPSQDGEVTDIDKATVKFVNAVMTSSKAASMFWELDFDRNLYGACVMRIDRALPTFPYIRWSKTPLDGFYPIFDPDDPDNLLEVYVLALLSREQVRQKYGVNPNDLPPSPVAVSVMAGDYIVKLEHWTRSTYETYLNGMRVDVYSGINPWGIVPFVYIPRMRTTDWWGESLVIDVYRPQDELNMRLADIGEALNVNMHPTRWGLNLPRAFNAKNFTLGPNALWDLGRSFDGKVQPEVGILQAEKPVPESAFEYIKFVYTWSRVSSSAPPIAFGEDDGGGQRSGVTLEIRLWPLLKAMRRSRSFFATGLRRALNITGRILSQKAFTDVDAAIPQALMTNAISPKFLRILPRDQLAAVDEVVKLLSTNPPAISLETSQTVLGRGVGEIDRINETVAMREAMAKRQAEMQAEFAPKPDEKSDKSDKKPAEKSK